MKQLIIMLLLGFGLFMPASVSLDKAVRDGLELSAGVRNKALDVQNADSRLRLARSGFLPELNAGASWRYQSRRMQLSIDPILQEGNILFPGLEKTVGTLHNWDIHLGIHQTLYSGGILSGRLAQAREQSITETLRLASQRLLRAGEIRAAFYASRLICRRRDSSLRLLERLELHARRLEALAAEDLVGRSDVLETRSRIAETRMQLEGLRRGVAEAGLRFHELTGHQVVEITPTREPRTFSRQEALAFFRAHHPRLEEFSARGRWLGQEEKVVAGRYLPQAVGYAELHLGRPGIDFFNSQWQTYASAGVRLSVPVFHWHRGRIERGLVSVAANQLKNRREEYIRAVAHTLDRLYVKQKGLEAQRREAEQLVDFAREDAQIKSELYAEKQVSNIDYLTAMVDLERFRTRLEEIDFERILTRIAIQRTIGYWEEKQ